MCHSTYITVVDHYQGIIRMCSRKEGDAHDCRSRASTACKTPQRSKQAYKWDQMEGLPVQRAAEVQGLEKATNTRYGKTIAKVEETGTILETPHGQ